MFLKSYKNDQKGAATIVAVMLVAIIIGILALTTDLTRTQTAYTNLQNSTDTSVLAAAEQLQEEYLKYSTLTLTDNLKDYAKNVLNSNLVKDQSGSTLTPSSTATPTPFEVTLDTETKVVTVKACVDTKNNFSANTDKSTVCTSSSAQIIKIDKKIDIAIAVDNGSKMQDRMTGNIAKQYYTKDFIKKFNDKFKVSTTALKNDVSISVIPFNDTVNLVNTTATDPVRIDKNKVNSWFKTPMSPITNFRGCIGRRDNPYDVTDDAPSDTSLKFNYYDWPQELLDLINVKAYGLSNSLYSTNTMTLQTDGNLVAGGQANFTFNIEKDPENSRVIIRFNRPVVSGGRFSQEIDYVVGGGTESVMLDLGRSYKSLSQTGANCYGTTEGGGKGETGRVSYFNYGGDSSAEYITYRDLPHDNAVTRNSLPYRYAKYIAINNGGGYGPGGCGPETAGYGGTDNSDFGISWISLGDCYTRSSVIMTNRKDSVDRVANSLTHSTNNGYGYADGLTRIDLGIAWAWRALSPKMKAYWSSIKPDLPYDYSVANKHLIVITQGNNYNPAIDNPKQLEVCTNVKNAGIDLYYITVGGDSSARSLASSCASSGKNYNLTDLAEVPNVVNQISSNILSTNAPVNASVKLISDVQSDGGSPDPDEDTTEEENSEEGTDGEVPIE